MITIKTPKEIEIMAEGGRLLALVLVRLEKETKAGVTTKELDEFAEKLIMDCGGAPSFKGEGGYPATTCISINEEVVHGIPSAKRFVNNGDIVSLDIGMVYKGFHTDMATTVGVGEVGLEMRRMIKVVKKSLKYGIRKARAGNTFGDVGNTIERFVEGQGFHVVRDLCGHGIGRQLHEDPQILNYGRRHKGSVIKEGMTFCIEPMITAGNPDIIRARDMQTYKIKDGSWAAHCEHTLAVFADGCRILTKLPGTEAEFENDNAADSDEPLD
jgi:methionyl aminopeptidase